MRVFQLLVEQIRHQARQDKHRQHGDGLGSIGAENPHDAVGVGQGQLREEVCQQLARLEGSWLRNE